jgi:hypothetical protein
MRRDPRTIAVLLACCATLIVGASPARALNVSQRKCLEAVAKDAAKFTKTYLKERKKYADKQLQDGMGDAEERDAKIAKATSKLRGRIAKKCGPPALPDPALGLKFLGFPGKCPDPDTGDGFTPSDLVDCIVATHGHLADGARESIADQLFALEYGVNGVDGASPLRPASPIKCQEAISKSAQKFVQRVLKEIRKCRNLLNAGKLSGFAPVNCGDNDVYPKPREKIAQAASKVHADIERACSVPRVQALDVCDTGSGPAQTPHDAADCIVATHRNATDDPDDSGDARPFPIDLIDVEYALGAICGDGIVNDPLDVGIGAEHVVLEVPEECDGADADACPGSCGDPAGSFPCLCTSVPRQRVTEHDNADLDVGWTGMSHDQHTVEGSSYVLDLYDCDGKTAMGGRDALCTVGASCNAPPHQACGADGDCPGGGNFCRKRITALGPHCSNDLQRACSRDPDCRDHPGDQGFCRTTPHGPPLPLAAGNVGACVENVFVADVTGTTNLDDGSFALVMRQDAATWLGSPSQPCPSCGYFCEAPGTDPGTRRLCQTDADCFGVPTAGVPGHCVTAAVCSFGKNVDQACRREPPFGSPTQFFGIPSVDCPREGSPTAVPRIVFNPMSSGTATLKPSVMCDTLGYQGKACIAGGNTGAPCSADSQCPGGGSGSCAFQCFCPPGTVQPEQPNPCFAACRGGANDLLPCSVDSNCPGGFCQEASCRVNPLDTDSAQEGFCPAGPYRQACSATVVKGCASNADCRRPACPACAPDDSETCVATPAQCFVNEGIVRVGSPGTPDAVGAATFCIAQTGTSAIDNVAGLPGPGALTQPVTTETTGVID